MKRLHGDQATINPELDHLSQGQKWLSKRNGHYAPPASEVEFMAILKAEEERLLREAADIAELRRLLIKYNLEVVERKSEGAKRHHKRT